LRTSRSLFCFSSASMPLITWDAACGCFRCGCVHVCVCVRAQEKVLAGDKVVRTPCRASQLNKCTICQA
jgi:hypothetical protein